MRSGVIAQKVGMTRVFTETGEHIPVTVLKLGNCQVLGHRTSEKERLPVALQLGFRHAQDRLSAEGPSAASFAVAKVEPKRKVHRVPRLGRRADPGRRRNSGGPFRGRPVPSDVTGTSVGKGFAGGIKRWNFGGLARHHPRRPRSRIVRSVSTGGTPGPRQDVQEQEDCPVTWVSIASPRSTCAWCRPDVERGPDPGRRAPFPAPRAAGSRCAMR